jgi:hypothetical protein
MSMEGMGSKRMGEALEYARQLRQGIGERGQVFTLQEYREFLVESFHDAGFPTNDALVDFLCEIIDAEQIEKGNRWGSDSLTGRSKVSSSYAMADASRSVMPERQICRSASRSLRSGRNWRREEANSPRPTHQRLTLARRRPDPAHGPPRDRLAATGRVGVVGQFGQPDARVRHSPFRL